MRKALLVLGAAAVALIGVPAGARQYSNIAKCAKWRNDRDVVRDKKSAPKKGKDGDKPKEKDPAKDKKPFVDKVLEKALQELHKEMKKAALEMPERAVG